MSKVTKKDLFTKIKEEADSIVVDDFSQNIKNNIKPNPTLPKNKKYFKWPLRLATVFGCVILIFIGLLVFEKETPITSYADVSKPHQTFGLQAVTLFNFVDNDQVKLLDNKRNSLIIKKLGNNNDLYLNISQEINEYLFSALDIFEKNNVEYREEQSDIPSYQTKMIMNVKMLNANREYILYFNEVSYKDYYDIDEVSSKIEGIIKTNSDQYFFEGKKEIENNEYEVELRMYLDDRKKDYYEVSQEIENSENEYSYKYYLDGVIFEEVEISIESKRLGKKIELEVTKGQKEVELEMHYHKDYIKVDYEIDELEGSVNVYPNEETTIYHFKDKEITIKNK